MNRDLLATDGCHATFNYTTQPVEVWWEPGKQPPLDLEHVRLCDDIVEGRITAEKAASFTPLRAECLEHEVKAWEMAAAIAEGGATRERR